MAARLPPGLERFRRTSPEAEYFEIAQRRIAWAEEKAEETSAGANGASEASASTDAETESGIKQDPLSDGEPVTADETVGASVRKVAPKPPADDRQLSLFGIHAA